VCDFLDTLYIRYAENASNSGRQSYGGITITQVGLYSESSTAKIQVSLYFGFGSNKLFWVGGSL
jgi:hypothetical protein